MITCHKREISIFLHVMINCTINTYSSLKSISESHPTGNFAEFYFKGFFLKILMQQQTLRVRTMSAMSAASGYTHLSCFSGETTLKYVARAEENKSYIVAYMDLPFIACMDKCYEVARRYFSPPGKASKRQRFSLTPAPANATRVPTGATCRA